MKFSELLPVFDEMHLDGEECKGILNNLCVHRRKSRKFLAVAEEKQVGQLVAVTSSMITLLRFWLHFADRTTGNMNPVATFK